MCVLPCICSFKLSTRLRAHGKYNLNLFFPLKFMTDHVNLHCLVDNFKTHCLDCLVQAEL